MSTADDFEAYFSFIFCILEILLISTFYAKLVLLHLHSLFEFSSTGTKMKTFCLEEKHCQVFPRGWPCCQDIFILHCLDCS